MIKIKRIVAINDIRPRAKSTARIAEIIAAAKEIKIGEAGELDLGDSSVHGTYTVCRKLVTSGPLEGYRVTVSGKGKGMKIFLARDGE